MARISWFLAASLSLFLGALGAIFSTRDLAYGLSDGWPTYHPSPGESLALDSATRTEVDARQPGILARFAEFRRRALTHDEFTGDHFDPGRMPA